MERKCDLEKKNEVLSALQYFYTVVELRVLEKVLRDQNASPVIRNSFALAHVGDNVFPALCPGGHFCQQ